MSIVALPTGLMVNRQALGVQNFDLEFSGGDTGAVQIAVLGPPRITCSLQSEALLNADQSAVWRSLVFSLAGRVNMLAVFDILNAAPAGTARGVFTVSETAAAGAANIRFNAGSQQAGKTLKAGDWIGVNQGGTNRQLLHVQRDVTFDGNGEAIINFQPVLRVAVNAGSNLVWDRPTCLMRRTSQTTSWTSEGAVQGGFQLELMEAWY